MKDTQKRCVNPVCKSTLNPESEITVTLQNGEQCCGPACARAVERRVSKEKAHATAVLRASDLCAGW